MSTRSRPSSISGGTGWKSVVSTGVTMTAAGLLKRSAMMSASQVEMTIFLSGMPIGRVHPRGVAVIEALVVLDEIELPPAAHRRAGHRLHRLPGRGDERVAVGQPRGAPLGHPAHARAEASASSPGARSSRLRQSAFSRPLAGHDHGDLVAARGQAVGVGQDGAHAAGDAQMRAEKRDLHILSRSPWTLPRAAVGGGIQDHIDAVDLARAQRALERRAGSAPARSPCTPLPPSASTIWS